MKSPKEILLLTLSIKQAEDIVAARQRTRQIMQLLGFRAIDQTHMATAISEIARNACQYAGEGKLQYTVKTEAPLQFLAYISDHGKGIAHLNTILSGQYRSSTGLGLGIIGAKKLVDHFSISSSPQQGTSVTLAMKAPMGKELSKIELAQIGEELVRNRPKSAPEEVQQQNQELLQALELLSKARTELEDRVKERTQELVSANQNLQLEIEKRKEVELSLREVSERLNLALQSAHIGTWYWSIPNNQLIWDKYASQLFGAETGNVERTLQDFLNFVIAEDRARIELAMKEMLEQNKNEGIEFRVHWPDGTMHYLMLRGKVYYDKENIPLSMIGVYWDITHQKEYDEKMLNYREQMSEAARKSSLGEMATSLAHEMNQPLAAILAYTKGCINRLNNDYRMTPEIFETLHEVASQAERAGEVVHRIKSFVRQGQLFYELVDINTLIDETIHLMQHDIELYPGLELSFVPYETSLIVEADKIQLQQVILNLTRNAMEAMKDALTSNPKLIIQLSLEGQEEIMVKVIDNGPGISEAIVDKIFDTYFTTKTQGTGLGLAICRSIIEAHGGLLSAITLPEGGSSFNFILPLKRHHYE